MTPSQNPSILARPGRPDLVAVLMQLQQRESTASKLMHQSQAAAAGPACANAYVRRFDSHALACAAAIDAQFAAGLPLPKLAGLAISVKDLFDVTGEPTTGGSAALFDAPPARADSVAVARLRQAGAAFTGHSNLSEFAFSGVGINPHFGTPANASTFRFNAAPRVPGGSTSGGATTVAAGAAWAALGSDTGGSIRIPAALQGLVGFKNTQVLTSTEGAIPLSTTLDTACAITLSVRDAVLMHEILAGRRVLLSHRDPSSWRLAVPRTAMLDGLDHTVTKAFERTLTSLRAAGLHIAEIDLPLLSDIGALQTHGTFAAAESWAWHRARLTEREAQYDARVAARIRMGSGMSAAQYIDLIHARKRWIAQCTAALQGFDALLSPTVPIVAPELQPLLADDAAFFDVNKALLRNPSMVNFLDGCALSLPCQDPDELPVGLMIWAPAFRDDTVLETALWIERALARREH